MIPALRNKQALTLNPINQPMFLRDAARPPTGQRSAQRLGLSTPGKGRSGAFFNEFIDALQQSAVSCLPMKVVTPSLFGKYELHLGQGPLGTATG